MPYPMPFPLASGRYEVGPSMRRMVLAEEGHFQPDDDLAAVLQAKLAVLKQAPGESHLVAPDLTAAEEEGLREAIWRCFALLAEEQPALASLDGDGVTLHHLGLRIGDRSAPTPGLAVVGEGREDLRPVARAIRVYLAEREGLWRLGDALALAVQEDLAIVRGLPSGDGQGGTDLLEWLHVCLPSNWSPIEKIGRSFGGVHAPVVHSERLLASQAQIIRAMIQAGPFVRYVWGLHRDSLLCHNPRIHQAAPWPVGAVPDEIVARAWFRVERQTTHGFADLNRALFTIRYWVRPFREVAADPWQREQLTSALAGMDESELRYKGLTAVREALVAWLKAK